ncbi:MAG: efflux RND transporter periplasmic adaptor subunit [Curvibacter sp.]|nr:MAG: efflux RND transporter periplasmic adaptor subunit [Curvibacter sp.]
MTQTQQPSGRRRWIKWAVLALVVLALGLSVLRALSARKAQQAAVAQASQRAQPVIELAPGDLVAAKIQSLGQGLPVSGTLRAVNSAFIRTRVPGELQELTVREGDSVQAGQVLARIEMTEFRFRLRQTQDQAESAKAQIDIAQRQYDNNKALVAQGFISQTALDTSLATLNGAIATYKAAQAAVEVTRKTFDDTVLKAPISGQVSQRLAQPGERLPVDSKVLEIVDLSRLELEATFSPTDSLALRVGQRARLSIEQNGRDNAAIGATVSRINPSAQSGSRSVLAYLTLDKPAQGGPVLRQGLFAQGTLDTEQVKALAVPLSAVRTDKPKPYVQWVQQGQIKHLTVTPGVRGEVGAEPWVAVPDLPEGTQVLRGELGPLREGTAVRVTTGPATAAAPVAAPASKN